MKVARHIVLSFMFAFVCQANAAGWARGWWDRLRGAFAPPPASEPAPPRARAVLREDYDAEAERWLSSMTGVYIEFEYVGQQVGEQAVSLKFETGEDGRAYFVIDVWRLGEVRRVFVAPLADIRPTRERKPAAFTLFLTEIGEGSDNASFGLSGAPFTVFAIKYAFGENAIGPGLGFENSMALNVKENGRKILDLSAMRMFNAEHFNEWRHTPPRVEGTSLADFVEGNYPEPLPSMECERHLLRRETPAAK